MSRLDLIAGSMLLLLFLSIAVVISYSNWLGVLVTLRTANSASQISPFEIITLNFSQPVQANEVENQLQIIPAVPGKTEWPDARTLRFIPTKAFQGNVTVHLVPGEITADGTWLRRDVSWKLSVRQPKIVYLNYAEPKRELMIVAVSGGSVQQLTFTGGNVFDFDVSSSGDELVYALLNEQKGIDLWLVGRNGQNPRKLLDCGGLGRCTSPEWSPDGRLIAYNLEAAPITPNAPLGVPRPRIIDVITKEDHPVFADQQMLGYGVAWSPDGNWLASYDGINDLIRVVNLKSGEQVALSSNYGSTGAWSPDSRYFLYANFEGDEGTTPKTVLYRADFQTGETSLFMGKSNNEKDYAYDVPAWSPAGTQIAIGMRVDPPRPARQIWLTKPDTLGGPVIANQPDYSYDLYEWDPWGTGLVIQQFDLTKPYYPEIAVWYPMQGLRMVIGNAMFPAWLP